MGKGVDSSDESVDEQSVEKSRYKTSTIQQRRRWDLLLMQNLHQVCKQIWGKALSNGKNKEELKKILIPSNCTTMKTPWLNTKIYITLNEGVQNKVCAAQTRQKEAVKEIVKENTGDKEALHVVETISPMLQNLIIPSQGVCEKGRQTCAHH